MGVFEHIASHAAVEAAERFSMPKEQYEEKKKWSAFFAVFALISLAAFYIQKHSMDDADLLGGKKTIEKFMHSNFTAMVVLLAAALGFVVVFFLSWKGMRSSIYQLIFTVAAFVMIVFSGVSIFRSIHNIQKDLDSPVTVTSENYVLCKRGNDYMLGFDEAGTIDSIILVIPVDKYNELKKGVPSNSTYKSRTWRLIDESQYVDYTDAVLYNTPIDITFYKYSVIYEDVSFALQDVKE